MKKHYDGLDLEVVFFDDEDVITASGCDCDDVKVVFPCRPDAIPLCPPQAGGCGCDCPMAEAICRIT